MGLCINKLIVIKQSNRHVCHVVGSTGQTFMQNVTDKKLKNGKVSGVAGMHTM